MKRAGLQPLKLGVELLVRVGIRVEVDGAVSFVAVSPLTRSIASTFILSRAGLVRDVAFLPQARSLDPFPSPVAETRPIRQKGLILCCAPEWARPDGCLAAELAGRAVRSSLHAAPRAAHAGRRKLGFTIEIHCGPGHPPGGEIAWRRRDDLGYELRCPPGRNEDAHRL